MSDLEKNTIRKEKISFRLHPFTARTFMFFSIYLFILTFLNHPETPLGWVWFIAISLFISVLIELNLQVDAIQKKVLAHTQSVLDEIMVDIKKEKRKKK